MSTLPIGTVTFFFSDMSNLQSKFRMTLFMELSLLKFEYPFFAHETQLPVYLFPV
jgi:hypothetical protein